MSRQKLGKPMTRLRFERLKQGVGQIELAYKSGISQTQISLFEQGFKIPNESELELMARVLKISPPRVLLQKTVIVHDTEVKPYKLVGGE